MEREKDENELQIDIGKIFFYILHRIWIVLICLVVGLAGGAAFGILTEHDTYSANATILVYYDNYSVSGSEDQTTNQTKVASIIGGCVMCVKQNRFAELVATTLNESDKTDGNGRGYDLDRDDIMEIVTYSYSIMTSTTTSDGNYIYVTSTADTAYEARDVLVTVTELFADYIYDTYLGISRSTTNFSVINDIELPEEADENTSILLYTLLAGLGCAVLCVLVMGVVFVVDKRVKGEEDLTEKYNIAVLGSIPDLDDKELANGGGY